MTESVREKFPGQENKALGAFWFLRLYCPSLVAPHAYGLCKENPNQQVQRELVLLSKVLQNLANEVRKCFSFLKFVVFSKTHWNYLFQEFGAKEQGMERLNEFITENKQALANFYNALKVKKIMKKKNLHHVLLNPNFYFSFSFQLQPKIQFKFPLRLKRIHCVICIT